MPTKTATLAVDISYFRPIGAVLTSATMRLIDGDPEYFKTDGTNIWVTIPKDAPPNLDIEVVFQASAVDYLLVGIAFNKTKFDPSVEGGTEFPQITITRDDNPIFPLNPISRLRVKDADVRSRRDINYDYYLFVQEVKSGSVGVIDPPFDTHGN